MPAVLSRLSPGCPGFGSAALLYSEVLNTDHETLCSAALTYLGENHSRNTKQAARSRLHWSIHSAEPLFKRCHHEWGWGGRCHVLMYLCGCRLGRWRGPSGLPFSDVCPVESEHSPLCSVSEGRVPL